MFYLYHLSLAHRGSPKRDNRDDKDTFDCHNRFPLCYVYENIRRIPLDNFLSKYNIVINMCMHLKFKKCKIIWIYKWKQKFIYRLILY